MEFNASRTQPITLTASTESQVYGLFGFAMAMTVAGVYAGMTFALPILTGGYHLLLFIVEMAIIFTAGFWAHRSPLNIILFAAFPFLSGLTFTPYLMYVLATYANGGTILLNALAATTCAAGAAALFARTTNMNLAGMGRFLLFGLIGLIVMGLLQIFFPAFRTGQIELLLSGAGVLLFSGFIAYDMQRIQAGSRLGQSPFLMALSLYLDIYNLFLYVLRFMIAISGDRR